jgi:hypothetical protein
VSSMPRRRAFIGKRATSKVEPWKIVKAGTGLGEPISRRELRSQRLHATTRHGTRVL